MEKPLSDHPFCQQEQEPDEIDMMNDANVRRTLRETLVALGQLQEEHGEMNLANVKYEKRIEQLEAALERFAKLPCSEYDTLQGTIAAVHILARTALGSAGDPLPPEQWATQLPTKAGWYWWRGDEINPKVMHVLFTEPEVTCATANQQYGVARSIGGEWLPNPIPLPVDGSEL